jgi:hypothetical protein
MSINTTLLPVSESVPASSGNAARYTRRRTRLQIALPLHVRPFDVRLSKIEDVCQTRDFTREGLYFLTSKPHYAVGMRLMVTFPYGEKVPAQRKFLATVVRLEDRGGDNRGVALRLLL